jgi:membrane dipeptidase
VALRLFDTHCDWLWQYASDSTTFDPSAYREIPARLPRLDGYMTATSAAVLWCSRKSADWENQADPWRSLGDLIARYESEFAGRLLIDPADFDGWHQAPPDVLTWGILGVSGLDYLVRDHADLSKLPAVFDRGIRVIQLVETSTGRLAGSAEPGDDRALSDLGRACLKEIAALSRNHDRGWRVILDLAHLNRPSMLEVIEMVEESANSGGVLLLYSHGALAHPGFDGPRALDPESLSRIRASGGLIGLTPGPPYHHSPEEFKSAIDHVATIPYLGRPGFEGIAVGCDFLELDATLPGLGDAQQLVEWLARTFDPETAALLLELNARRFLASAFACKPP